MKGARSRQEQLARERIQALKNKRKLSKKEDEAKKEKEQEDKENEALESNDPIQLQVIYKLTSFRYIYIIYIYIYIQYINRSSTNGRSYRVFELSKFSNFRLSKDLQLF